MSCVPGVSPGYFQAWRRRPRADLTVFAGQNVGIKEVSDKIWLVSFMKYDLRFFDQEVGRVTSVENPFDAKVTYVTGMDHLKMVGVTGFEPATPTSRT